MLNGPCTPGYGPAGIGAARSVIFPVHGKPAPQGSKSAFATKTGKVVMVEKAGATLYSWRDSVIRAASEARSFVNFDEHGPLDGALHVSIDFYLPMPATRPKKIREERIMWRPHSPDIDKLTRSVLDGLTQSMLIKDDAQVCGLTVMKMESTMWTGANICVYEKEYGPSEVRTLIV